MPPRAKRPCRHRGCTAVTNNVGGYCEMHRQQHAGDGWRNYQPGKTRQERGYGRPWEIKRARIMKRDKYLCQNCRRDGIATKASSVDHIIPKAHGGIRNQYRSGNGCDYAGTRYFDRNNQPVDVPSQDVCNGTLTFCKLRHGENSELPFGGFPGTSLIRS